MADIDFCIIDPYERVSDPNASSHVSTIRCLDRQKVKYRFYNKSRVELESPRIGDPFHALLAMALTPVSIERSGICLLASDVELREKFVEKLDEVVTEMRGDGIRDFVLSGYDPYDLQAKGTPGKHYRQYPAQWFYGFECLFFPGEVAASFRRFISHAWKETVRHDEPPGLVVNRFCRSEGFLYGAVRSLVQHVGSQRLLNEMNHLSPTFNLPWPGPEEDELYGGYRNMADDVRLRSESCRRSRGRARGIIICTGGMKYFTCAWVCARILREIGCQLPIEFWHLGREEMTGEMRLLADRLGVKCVDAHEVRREHPVRRLGGWELKCYAILHSRFREVLLLDADNVPVVDPSFLFGTPEYRETGAIFWPDIGSLGPERDIWKITGVPYNPAPDFESGQIVVDKKRCWKALQLAMHFNEHSDFYYQHIYGDKDTFRFAFLKTGTPFSMPSRRIEYIDGTLCQHDFSGRRIFQHRIKKWSLNGRNQRTKGFLFEEECLGFLDELRKLWRTGVPSAQGPRQMLIPRVLHRLWLRPEPLGARQRRWAASWRKHHPQWDEKVWTFENLPELTNRLEFDRAIDPQQRMEIAGYELLHRFGGVLVDADFECLRPLDELLAGEECLLGEESPGKICHGLIAAVPGHEFVKELVCRLPFLMRENKKKSPVDQTGANYVTQALRDRQDVTVLPPEYFHPEPHESKNEAGRKQPRSTPTAHARHHHSAHWQPLPGVIYQRRFSRFDPRGKTARELATADALTGGFFDYHRIGHDRRKIQFLPDGTIGEGQAGCERAWDVVEEGNEVHLSILGSGYVTCRLVQHEPGCWQGAWLICEKMPVELTPIG